MAYNNFQSGVTFNESEYTEKEQITHISVNDSEIRTGDSVLLGDGSGNKKNSKAAPKPGIMMQNDLEDKKNNNDRDYNIPIVIPINWVMGNEDSMFRGKLTKHSIKITNNTTLNHLKQLIVNKTLEITYKDKQFCDLNAINVVFESKENIFHNDTWKNQVMKKRATGDTKNNNNDDNDNNVNNEKILQLYDESQLPQILTYKDNKSKNSKWSYKLYPKIKNQHKYDWCELGHFQRAHQQNGNPTASKLLNFDRGDAKYNNNNNNNNINFDNNVFNRLNSVDSIYLTDKLNFWGQSPVMKKYVTVWKQLKLHKKTDDELYKLLISYYKHNLLQNKLKIEDVNKMVNDMKNKVDDKINNKIHVFMGKPLSKSMLLSLVLYTDTSLYKQLLTLALKINQDISDESKDKEQKEYKEDKENKENKENDAAKMSDEEQYPFVFDFCVFWAITALNYFNNAKDGNKSRRQLYSGAWNRWFDPNKFLKNENDKKEQKNNQNNNNTVLVNDQYVEFIKHTSFSGKVSKAKEFIRDGINNNGSMIILNDSKYIVSCDATWISKYDSECEILVRRHCGVPIKKIIENSDHTRQLVLLGDDAQVDKVPQDAQQFLFLSVDN